MAQEAKALLEVAQGHLDEEQDEEALQAATDALSKFRASGIATSSYEKNAINSYTWSRLLTVIIWKVVLIRYMYYLYQDHFLIIQVRGLDQPYVSVVLLWKCGGFHEILVWQLIGPEGQIMYSLDILV